MKLKNRQDVSNVFNCFMSKNVQDIFKIDTGKDIEGCCHCIS